MPAPAVSAWNFHSGNYTGTSCPTQSWEVWSTGAATTSSRWAAPNQPAWTAEKATSSETRGNPSCSTQPDGWIGAATTEVGLDRLVVTDGVVGD
ncbi:hypothetical protein Sfulv_00730 [Streptomyces fulvorobeus]|uniref:Uncharacterized protein n=1 Tax=Streptomyces fulvorobeus TaxID=284028 RepID=A0A7J0BYE6_9ACTN|nr:hypothetical protein [Streptomyces fulvorobeus]NYE39066.1 hypothetical protein [Streptomyces fulvorobeus]GFM95262.1 hypothetical protein Sfulv_00730 [Streptomyces fulvorobeus]